MDKKKVIAAGIGAAAIVAAGVGFFLKPGKGMGPNRGGMMQEAAYTVVKADHPTTGNVSVTSSLTGTVEAAEMIYIYSKAAGDVHAVNVKAGDWVEAGQVLFEIDTEQVESTKNSMDSAEISMKEAQSTLERMKILYAGGDLSEQEYEGYVNRAKSARLQYESAKLNYNRQVEHSSVTAPISGRIESCDIEVYDRIQNNTQMCVIAGEGENTLTFYVTDRMVKHLSEGDELKIVKNKTDYAGVITEISTMVDSSTGLFKVKGAIEKAESIPLGSTVKIILVTDKTENALLVPVDAIYYSGGDGYVYTYEDGTAHMRSVQVGLCDDTHAEILSGISDTDLVIGTWSSNLYEGAKVRLMSELEAEEAAEGNDAQGKTPERSMTGGGAPQGAGGPQEGGMPQKQR